MQSNYPSGVSASTFDTRRLTIEERDEDRAYRHHTGRWCYRGICEGCGNPSDPDGLDNLCADCEIAGMVEEGL